MLINVSIYRKYMFITLVNLDNQYPKEYHIDRFFQERKMKERERERERERVIQSSWKV